MQGDLVLLELVPATAVSQDLVAHLPIAAPALPTGSYEVYLDGKIRASVKVS